MKVYINGELNESINTVDMLQRIIADISLSCTKEDKVMEIMVNGVYVEHFYPEYVDEQSKIEISIKTVSEIIAEGLKEAKTYLPKLLEGLTKVTTYFRDGDINHGAGLFEQTLDGLNWIYHLVSGLNIQSVEHLKIDQLNYQRDQEGFEDVLKELLTAWESEDFILISDLVEYELIPVLDRLRKHFDQIVSLIDNVV